ncbi:unnamed protein product [Pieris macdunnoughi]|uniref:Major facilitator superfamily (MFS) profile domain-containing protein n=1 Tax=Pieris macdunnoughi TaxID=345717 RepID=A0A821RZQ4_9NEOP|nr:unnamed protein product [Pieris macdunnoughi]
MDSEKGKSVVSDIFEKFGKYQIIQYFLACLPIVFVSMNNVNYVFIAGDIEYRCYVPECENSTTEFLVPWWPDTVPNKCLKPILKDSFAVGEICTNETFTGQYEACTRWVYESNDTVVGELDMACEPWRTNFIGMTRNIGMAVSMLIIGWLCDRIGRKPALIICSLGVFLGNFKTMAKSYNLYIFFEFIESSMSGGAYTAATVLMIEIGGKKTRFLAGVLFAYAIYMGEAIFACIAMFVPYWKHLLYIMCSPSLIFLSYFVLLKESPRWQILNRRTEKAKKTLRKIAGMNKINVNLDYLDTINEGILKQSNNAKTKREGYVAVLKSKEMMKRLLVAAFCRFAVSFIYYGLIVNSVYLPGNKYTNFLLAAVMSFPGEIVSMYFMNKVGRKLPLCFGYVICAAANIASAYTPEDYIGVKITLFLIGKLLVAACYTGIATYTMELFPTSVRGSLLGFCTLASCAGSTLAPLSSMLTTISPILTSFCFGCVAVISSLLLILTPETKDLPLMDTIIQIYDHAAEVKKRKEEKKQKCAADNNAFDLDYSTHL